MSFNAHDNIVLVAPRPVRLATSTYTQFHPSIVHRPQPRSSEYVDEELRSDQSDREPASPRLSPRSNLSSEALEEFLSILRPSTTLLFPPTSPILRATKASVANAYFPYRRTPCSVSPSIPAEGLGLTAPDEIDKENDSQPFRYFGKGPLASPVARHLTRNPFQRHASYESTVTTYISTGAKSPSPVNASLSPAAIPLPSPGPDEADL
ncbi:unnamed protein product [Somion occarium]|uniref:Uncharacterized protein n=1 Tax=Somion occarium TaxID=3059160 RepID=A0ABP1D917_9APHY